MARYTSGRANFGARLGGLILALVGAISFAAVWKAARHAGVGVRHNPVAAALVVLGLGLVLWSFRDHILGAVGLTTPRRAERLIRMWLDTQHYTMKQDARPPNFVLTVTDTVGRAFLVSWQTEPYPGVQVATSWGVGVDLANVWLTATDADLRGLRLHLMEVGRVLEGGTVQLNNLEDAATFRMFYISLIPRDLINYEEFFHRLTRVQGCLVMAINYVDDLYKTLAERMGAPTPELPPVPPAGPQQ